MGRHVIFDFDGTITEDDTIGNLAHNALQWRKTHPEGGSVDLTAAWHRIQHAYVQDLAAYDQTQPDEQQRTTLALEREYLRGRRVVEEASLARVREAGIFAGFFAAAAAAADNNNNNNNNSLLFEAGCRDRETGRTRIRRGFADFVGLVRARGDAVHVVSVNWSASYIRGVLAPWGITSIVANEIQLDGSIAAAPLQLADDIQGVGLGDDDNTRAPFPRPSKAAAAPLATSSDKLAATQRLLGTMGGGECAGYFGDSTTDLECLDYYGGGVLTSDGQGSLARTLRRLGYALPCISEPQGANARISWAADFTEIVAKATRGSVS